MSDAFPTGSAFSYRVNSNRSPSSRLTCHHNGEKKWLPHTKHVALGLILGNSIRRRWQVRAFCVLLCAKQGSELLGLGTLRVPWPHPVASVELLLEHGITQNKRAINTDHHSAKEEQSISPLLSPDMRSLYVHRQPMELMLPRTKRRCRDSHSMWE